MGTHIFVIIFLKIRVFWGHIFLLLYFLNFVFFGTHIVVIIFLKFRVFWGHIFLLLYFLNFVFFPGHILLLMWLTAVGDLVRKDVKSYTYRILVEKFLRKICVEE